MADPVKEVTFVREIRDLIEQQNRFIDQSVVGSSYEAGYSAALKRVMDLIIIYRLEGERCTP